jgi:hypothetical protein
MNDEQLSNVWVCGSNEYSQVALVELNDDEKNNANVLRQLPASIFGYRSVTNVLAGTKISLIS